MNELATFVISVTNHFCKHTEIIFIYKYYTRVIYVRLKYNNKIRNINQSIINKWV